MTAVSVAGIPGQGTSGVKAWLALIVIKTRLGPGRPRVRHDWAQAIGVPSSHSQLRGKLAGKLSAGKNRIAPCIEFWMPTVSSGRSRAYSAPMRAVAANAADLAARMPKSAVPAAIIMTIGATSANSAATLPRQPRRPLSLRRPRCRVQPTLALFGQSDGADRRKIGKPSARASCAIQG